MINKLQWNSDYSFNYDVVEKMSEVVDELNGLPDLGATGFAQYSDTIRTLENPLVITQGSNILIPNNAGSTIPSQLPIEGTHLYDGTTNTFTPYNVGDAYILRIGFDRYTTSNTGYGEITLDIGAANPILNIPVEFPRGTGSINARKFVVSELIYSFDTFIANGGKLYFESVRGDTSIYNISYVIARIPKGK